jgi:hypothetical protein
MEQQAIKLAIFGDSFGVQKLNQPYASWVDLLSQHFDITNHCECGVSEYKILKQLQRTDLTQFDKILIVHTSATRTYVKYNPLHFSSEYHKNCDIILADVENGDTEFNIACQLYFKHIFDLEYAIDIHNMICNKINEYCLDKPTVHTTHFDYSDLFQFPDMISFHDLFLNHRGDVNHYTKIGNCKVYQSLLKVL